jgi:RNA polymerase sigma-70 factor (ECF subfamily)
MHMAKQTADLKKARDEELVILAREENTRAFDELVNRYQSKIYRLARRLTETEEDAEDVLQEAFVKAYKSLGGFKGKSRFSTWLYRITVNLALMKLRKKKLDTVPLDQPIETGDGVVQREIEDGGPDPLDSLIAAESRQILDAAVADLPAGHRAVFILRDVEKLSTEDTARVLGITVPAVKSRLHRTRLMLKERLIRAAAARGMVLPDTGEAPVKKGRRRKKSETSMDGIASKARRVKLG